MNLDKMKIGGDIPVKLDDLKGISSFSISEHEKMFSNGRTALMAILEHISNNIKQKNKIYVPYYICHSVVDACIKVGYSVKFYELNKNFLLPISELENIEKNAVLLTVNYFGFVDDNQVVEYIKKERSDIVTISDRVQDYFSLKEAKADYSFTSLRKAFPIPEGGLVFTKHYDFFDNFNYPENNFYIDKYIGSFIKSDGGNDADYLYFYKKGEQALDESERIEKASMMSQYLYYKCDFSEEQKIRQRNYEFIYEEGEKFGLRFLFDFKENITPLVVPILIENRDRVRRKLLQNNIFLPVHWPVERFNKESEISRLLGENELSLIIDQRYNLSQITYILKFINL